MSVIKPFRAIRPADNAKASQIAALPYDVYNREEAKAEVEKNPMSFLKVDRAETQFPDDVSTYDPRVYSRAKELLDGMREDGSYITDEKRNYYIYELTMDGRSQAGLVACASIDDYLTGVIKKHENTRAEKEQDRIDHVNTCSAQTGPIFLAYRGAKDIDVVMDRVMTGEPVYDFTSEDGVGHRVWVIDDPEDIGDIGLAFMRIAEIYIADGHHRCASAVKVGQLRRKEAGDYDGTEEFNFFLCVLFPDHQLKILDYNRVVKDLNGMSAEEFLGKVKEVMDVDEIDASKASPTRRHTFGMFLDGKWYSLSARREQITGDPVKGLDVSILQDYILEPLLGIEDPKTDDRIDFVGGIRGMDELERRCSVDCRVAFSMYPTSISELFEVADAGMLMPPKSTWFEPKLRSGLFIHEI
ncbi:MAG: DUF1015 family protein [Eubacterium sp.]|nr:DUF1015 family protein [Eubacterium sp.]